MRVLGLWLLYATVGVLVAVAALSSGGKLKGSFGKSPTRLSSKVVSGISGIMFAIVGVGFYTVIEGAAPPEVGRVMVMVSGPIALLLSAWSMVLIARDLKQGSARSP